MIGASEDMTVIVSVMASVMVPSALLSESLSEYPSPTTLPPPSFVLLVALLSVVPLGPFRLNTVDLYSSQSPFCHLKPPFLAQKKNQIAPRAMAAPIMAI